jgi:hypothetical protein
MAVKGLDIGWILFYEGFEALPLFYYCFIFWGRALVVLYNELVELSHQELDFLFCSFVYFPVPLHFFK